MGKRISLIALMLAAGLLRGYAGTIVAAVGGGTFSVATTWVGGVVPGSTDTVVINSSCIGNITMTLGATIARMDFTGYTKTFTITGNNNLTVAGNLTLSAAAGFLITGTGSVQLSQTSTITSNGTVMDVALRFSGVSVTYTLNGDLVCNKQVTILPSSNSATGTYTATTNERLIARAGLTVMGPSSITTTQGTVVFEIQGGTLSGGSTVATVKNNINIVPSASAITIVTGGTAFAFNTGTITYTPSTFGVTHATGSVLTLSGSCTLNTPGMAWDNITVNTGGITITLNGALTLNHALTHTTSGAVTYAGTSSWTAGSFSATNAGNTTTLTAGYTYTITGGITTTGTAASGITVQSSSGVKAILTIQQGATEDCLYTNATAIDCSAGKTWWITKPSVAGSSNVLSRPMEPGQVADAN